MADSRSALFSANPLQPQARAWREAFARLSPTMAPCPGFRPGRWPEVHTACLRFLSDHADRAAALGWSTTELFGVHPEVGAVRVDACGALMVSGGKPVDEVHADRIVIGAGVYRRTPGAPPSVPVWEYREPPARR